MGPGREAVFVDGDGGAAGLAESLEDEEIADGLGFALEDQVLEDQVPGTWARPGVVGRFIGCRTIATLC